MSSVPRKTKWHSTLRRVSEAKGRMNDSVLVFSVRASGLIVISSGENSNVPPPRGRDHRAVISTNISIIAPKARQFAWRSTQQHSFGGALHNVGNKGQAELSIASTWPFFRFPFSWARKILVRIFVSYLNKRDETHWALRKALLPCTTPLAGGGLENR